MDLAGVCYLLDDRVCSLILTLAALGVVVAPAASAAVDVLLAVVVFKCIPSPLHPISPLIGHHYLHLLCRTSISKTREPFACLFLWKV